MSEPYDELYAEFYAGTLSVDDLAEYLKAGDSNYSAVVRSLYAAFDAVDRFIGARRNKVPEATYVLCVLMVGQDLYYKQTRSGDSGGGQYAVNGDFISTVPRKDPLYYVYPILRPFVGYF